MKERQGFCGALSLELGQVGFGPAILFICTILGNKVSVLSTGG